MIRPGNIRFCHVCVTLDGPESTDGEIPDTVRIRYLRVCAYRGVLRRCHIGVTDICPSHTNVTHGRPITWDQLL